MLNECRTALKINGSTLYDSDLCDLMYAAVQDLQTAGVVLPGTVSFSENQNGTITDNSTLDDRLVMRAIFSYVDWQFFRNAANVDKRKENYELQKVALMHASEYTNYDGGDTE